MTHPQPVRFENFSTPTDGLGNFNGQLRAFERSFKILENSNCQRKGFGNFVCYSDNMVKVIFIKPDKLDIFHEVSLKRLN